MTSLQIIPSFTRKTAKIVGKVAAGEHVSVTVVGGNAVITATLYLRIVCCGKTIAQFPAPESNDAWAPSGDDLKCVINLNTVEALKFCRGPETGCLAVFEDLGDSDNRIHPQLYFVSDVIVNGWPQKRYGE